MIKNESISIHNFRFGKRNLYVSNLVRRLEEIYEGEMSVDVHRTMVETSCRKVSAVCVNSREVKSSKVIVRERYE